MDRGLNDIQNPSKQIVTDTKSANAHLESMWNYRNVKRETIPGGVVRGPIQNMEIQIEKRLFRHENSNSFKYS